MVSAALQRQRGYLLTFAPVFFGTGIGIFFAQGQEPGWPAYGIAAAVAVVALWVARVRRFDIGPLFAASAVVALGFLAAGWRAHTVAGPVIDFRYYGTIEGRVVAIDRSSSDRVRLTLDRVYLDRTPPERTPRRVRVSLHGQDGLPVPSPGSHALLTGHLSPPPSPAEPHGFDFERHAWFLKLGGVGYTRAPALIFAPPEPGLRLAVLRFRMALSAAVQAQIPGQAGAVAAAVTTGDRSAMSQEVVENLRHSNLAHLLAISGLHMGLLTGFVFALTRVALALYPPIALRWPTRKIAALVALAAGAGYLALSGGAVATERAYIMAAVVFGAVLFDRRALTLRAVALAALIVLALQPEALLGPGFQMSFAATTALVVTFRWLSANDMFGMPRALRPSAAVVISSAVAGFATAPIAAAHFNIISHFGLIANLLSVPIMGAFVMPAAVIAAILSLVGAAAPALWVMELGLTWILWVAAWVSDIDGAVGRVYSPDPRVLPMMTLGALALVLWRGRARWGGLAIVAASFALWAVTERPAMLISPSGGLVGVMGAEGRVLTRARGDGFAARSWLENDADFGTQEEAFDRGELVPITLGPHRFHAKTGVQAKRATCAEGATLILNQQPEAPLDCPAITPATLRDTGALALSVKDADLLILTTRDVTGHRLWNSADVRAAWR